MDIYGLIGKNIDYSFSRAYFKEKFIRENILNSQYVNFDIPTIESFVSILNSNHKGYNVTIPYKESIISYLDSLSSEAKEIGAVNTIKITKKGLIGFNTDYLGFLHSIKPLLKPIHTKALILGNGGASKAVVFALEKLNISTLIAARNPWQNEITFEQISSKILKEYTIVINTTPLGTYPNIEAFPPMDYNLLSTKHLIYDLIYNPAVSTFLQKAKNQGATIINGETMLKIQAEKAWEIWQTIDK